MARKHSIADARSNLPQLIRDAEAGQAIELTRRGEGVAVLIGLKQYERFTARTRSFSKALKDFRDAFSVADLDIDPDEVFADARDKSAGRDPKL